MVKQARQQMAVIAFAQEHPKGMRIALDPRRSKVIGSLIPIHQTTFHAVNGSAGEANQ